MKAEEQRIEAAVASIACMVEMPEKERHLRLAMTYQRMAVKELTAYMETPASLTANDRQPLSVKLPEETVKAWEEEKGHE